MKKGILFINWIGNGNNYWNGSKSLAEHSVQDLRGRTHSLSDYASEKRSYAIRFWKTCCPNNITMIDELNEVWQEYDNSEKPIKIVLVSVDDQRTASRVKPIVGSNGWLWDVVMDKNGDLARIYHITMPPQWVAVNSFGKIIYRSKVTNGTLDSAIYFDELITEMNKNQLKQEKMKKVMLMMAMCLGMFACGNSNAKSNKATEEQSQKTVWKFSIFTANSVALPVWR